MLILSKDTYTTLAKRYIERCLNVGLVGLRSTVFDVRRMFLKRPKSANENVT